LGKGAVNPLGIPKELVITLAMTHWQKLTKENVEAVPPSIIGVFQLSRDGETIHFVGRSDENLRDEIAQHMADGYTHFQWVKLPWVKETYEMHCRLFHLAGGVKKLDNKDHPEPPNGKSWLCQMSVKPSAMCNL
jgi:hypothetical protein